MKPLRIMKRGQPAKRLALLRENEESQSYPVSKIPTLGFQRVGRVLSKNRKLPDKI
jgi:hypothetical protein